MISTWSGREGYWLPDRLSLRRVGGKIIGSGCGKCTLTAERLRSREYKFGKIATPGLEHEILIYNDMMPESKHDRD